jgi:hypothetical protein
VGGYVGESTRREIERARSRGIPVRFLEPPPAPETARVQPGAGVESGKDPA